MTCTDHDLKRFKYFCHEDGAIGTFLVTKLIARLEASEDIQNGERCEVCSDQGWYRVMHGGVDPDGENDTREAVQVQCQFCYENPKSVFNKIRVWRDAAGK